MARMLADLAELDRGSRRSGSGSSPAAAAGLGLASFRAASIRWTRRPGHSASGSQASSPLSTSILSFAYVSASRFLRSSGARVFGDELDLEHVAALAAGPDQERVLGSAGRLGPVGASRSWGWRRCNGPRGRRGAATSWPRSARAPSSRAAGRRRRRRSPASGAGSARGWTGSGAGRGRASGRGDPGHPELGDRPPGVDRSSAGGGGNERRLRRVLRRGAIRRKVNTAWR